MANTITQQTLYGGGSSKNIVKHIHIVSDGTEEADLVVYDNSAFVADVTKGRILKVMATGSACVCRLEFDQTTDAVIISLDPASNPVLDYTSFGGISNPGGSGATGDVVLTTAGLDVGDEVSLILYIEQN